MTVIDYRVVYNILIFGSKSKRFGKKCISLLLMFKLN